MKCLILCIGNRDGGDDAVGPYIADVLLRKNLENIIVIDAGTVPENFTGEIKRHNPEKLVIIDAIDMGVKPGGIRIVPKEKLGVMHISTHGIPISVLIDYLQQYIQNIVLIGLQPKTMQGEITEEIKESADTMIKFILKEQVDKIPKI